MDLEILKVIRNILLRCFVIGVVIAVILGLVTMSGWTTWVGMAGNWFHTDSNTLAQIVLKFFTDIRLILLFFVLTPALAIHWTIKRGSK
jgi:predicted negative regulator of RcsB-dependent stress response